MPFHLAPIFFQEFLLKRAQNPPGRSHQIEQAALAQEGQVFFAHDAAIKNPDPTQGSVLALYRIENLLQGNDICPVAS